MGLPKRAGIHRGGFCRKVCTDHVVSLEDDTRAKHGRAGVDVLASDVHIPGERAIVQRRYPAVEVLADDSVNLDDDAGVEQRRARVEIASRHVVMLGQRTRVKGRLSRVQIIPANVCRAGKRPVG